MIPRMLVLLASALLPACQRAERVDACAVLTNPASYEGRRLELTGSVWAGPDGRASFRACQPPNLRQIAVVWRAGVQWTPPTSDVPLMIVTAIVEREGSGWRLDGISYEGVAFMD